MTEIKYVTSKDDLIEVFKKIGVKRNMDIMVHSSMKSLGYVVNGPFDVIDALLSCLTKNGTLLMPAHTGQLTDPSYWQNPKIPKKYVSKIKKYMYPFDCNWTPTRNRGIIAETFSKYYETARSYHPLNSVSALGYLDEWYTSKHPLHESEGRNSPIGKLYMQGGYILLIGVTLNQCTAIHLAEFLADVPYLKKSKIKVLTAKNKFTRLKKYPNGSEYFNNLMPELRAEGIIKQIKFCEGMISFFPIVPVVDLAVKHLKNDPNFLIEPLKII